MPRATERGAAAAPLIAITAQSIEINHGNSAPLNAEQALAFENLKALVRRLPRHSRQEPDLLLRDFDMHARIAIKHRIEQPGDIAREAPGRVEHPVVFGKRDKLSQPLVQVADQKAIEGDAVLEQ